VATEHLEERRIDEYLAKHGINSMKDLAPKKMGAGSSGGAGLKRRQTNRRKPMQNDHLQEQLKDYSTNN
jgi:hypothetical protein